MAAKRFLAIGECMIEMSVAGLGAWKLGYAGDTLNVAWYARAMLSHRDWDTAYFTCVGADRYSNDMMAFLAANGIDTGVIRIVPHRRPGIYFIHQQDGDRHFTYWRENSAARLLADDATALEAAVFCSDAVVISGVTLAILSTEHRRRLIAILGEARRRGITTAFDPNIRTPMWEDAQIMLDAIMHAASVSKFVLPTFGDDEAAFGDKSKQETANRYIGAGADEVVVKDGGGEALIMTCEGSVAVPALTVPDPVDPTGAGDAFNGAYLASRLAGADIHASATAAHKVAAKVICQQGALLDMRELA